MNKEEDIKRLYKKNEISALYYHELLMRSPYFGYFLERGLSLHIIKDFLLGYAPTSGRVMFPIQNEKGDTVAFTGRVLDDSLPKYLNSPATPIFNKSAVLYGLPQGKYEIIEKNAAIIVEGQMDVLSLHQAGFKHAVGISGTALTPDQIGILKKFTDTVYLCLDSDDAGKKATFASIENLTKQDMDTYIISLGEYKDPDDLLKADEDFMSYINESRSYIRYIIEESDVSSIEKKKDLLSLALKYMKDTTYISSLSDILEIPCDVIEKELLLKTK